MLAKSDKKKVHDKPVVFSFDQISIKTYKKKIKDNKLVICSSQDYS